MTKQFITGDLTQPVTIDTGGTWVLAGNQTIEIAAPPVPGPSSTGIRTLDSAAGLSLVVKGDIMMGGAQDVGILIGSDDAQLTIGANSTISAGYGVLSDNAAGEATMVNAGLIDASLVGVYQSAGVSHFTNEATGKINGVDAIRTGIADDGDSFNFVNKGEIVGSDHSFLIIGADANIRNINKITGDVALGSGNDRFNTRFGDLFGDIYGGNGSDVFILKDAATMIHENPIEGIDLVKIAADYALDANIENLTLLGTGNFNATGNASANVITGNKGANQILGLEGNDTLNGGRGNDTLTGWLDADTFIFHRNGDIDTITDFADGEDHVQLKGWKTIDEYADFSGRISQVGADVVIKFGDGDKLILTNFEMSDLTADDFIF